MRKFTLPIQQNTSILSSERDQTLGLLCQGRGYEADASTPAIDRRRSKVAAERRSPSRRTSSLPLSTSGEVTVARTARSNAGSVSQLAQSIRVQRIQPRRSPAARPSTCINLRDTLTATVISSLADSSGGN